jgi:hypothetical protein
LTTFSSGNGCALASFHKNTMLSTVWETIVLDSGTVQQAGPLLCTHACTPETEPEPQTQTQTQTQTGRWRGGVVLYLVWRDHVNAAP